MSVAGSWPAGRNVAVLMQVNGRFGFIAAFKIGEHNVVVRKVVRVRRDV